MRDDRPDTDIDLKPRIGFDGEPLDPLPEDDATRIADNGGFVHLMGALEEERELEYDNGEDSDGDPHHPANVNSRAYNPELEENDEPMIDPEGHVRPTSLDQVADLAPDSEKPRYER